ncbi:MAG: ubiquinol-cytochrome c reductase iron-sulfur subunit, partial [Pseudomonadota bacterium]
MSSTQTLASLEPQADQGRRTLLLLGTSALGVVGTGFAAWPFYASWKPSAKAKVIGAPVTAFIGDLQPGQILRVQWRGQPIGLLRRSEEMVALLPEVEGDLGDPNSDNLAQQPEYARNQHRSIRPDLLVMNMFCTHLGCV